ncbi:unnamed protein product [Cuscuta campestris]|uniref:Uncharacterized protein n=1 Tax=Cuscuta campestris TaxID=132261 RepID=A0A484KL26_9ASTE|nr:unnamed protein product [Cuscuta campestris]
MMTIHPWLAKEDRVEDHGEDRRKGPWRGPRERTAERSIGKDRGEDCRRGPRKGPPERTAERTAEEDHEKDRRRGPRRGPPEGTSEKDHGEDRGKDRRRGPRRGARHFRPWFGRGNRSSLDLVEDKGPLVVDEARRSKGSLMDEQEQSRPLPSAARRKKSELVVRPSLLPVARRRKWELASSGPRFAGVDNC